MNQPHAWQTYDRCSKTTALPAWDDPSGIERTLTRRRPATKERADC